MTEIIKVGAQSSGGSGGKLFEILAMQSPMDIAEFDEYVNSIEGLHAISDANTFPEVWNDNVLHYLLNSDSFLEAVFANVELGTSLILREDIYPTLFADKAKGELFFTSSTNLSLLETAELNTFFRNTDYMYQAIVNPAAMRKIAQDNLLLGLAFATPENRIRMFDVGGKEIADILLREFSSARAYLSSISQYATHPTQSWYNTGKRGYLLEVYCNSSGAGGSLNAGTFLGDYRTGDISVSGLSKNPVIINERVNPVKFMMNYNYSGYNITGRWVNME